MAYIKEYADRVRAALAETPNITETKMFGSLGFMINGHLTIGIGDGKDGSVIMVRVGKTHAETFLQEHGATASVMGQREMLGWIDLTENAVQSEEALRTWIDRGITFIRSLPPKDS